MEKKTLNMSDNDTLKWRNDGKLYCLHTMTDENPESPREWDNLCTLACWHRRYNLGDNIGNVDAEDFFRDLVRKNVPEEDVLKAALEGNISGIRAVKTGDDEYDVYETYFISSVLGKSEPGESLEYSGIGAVSAGYYIIDDLTVAQSITLLEPYAVIVPLWLYDHGGITISCGSRQYPYNDRWDSGCVGYAVALKEKIMKETVGYVLDENGEKIREEYKHENAPSTWGYKTVPLTEDTWKARAEEIINGEVELYDQYLRGDVYGFKISVADEPEEDEEPDWMEEDSCWGFYGDNILENGITDEVGYGLSDAIKSGEYETGKAVLHTKSYYAY